MSPDDHDREDETAAWLVRVRPAPREEFTERLERDLVGRARARRSLRVYLAGAGVTGALASALVVAALVGGGPLGADDDDARAREDCQVLQVRTTESEGRIVERNGEPTVVTVQRPVTREVKRCR